MLGKLPKITQTSLCGDYLYDHPLVASPSLCSYLNLAFPHDLVHYLVVVLIEHALIVALLIAQDPQVLGAFQLDLKLLLDDKDRKKSNLT